MRHPFICQGLCLSPITRNGGLRHRGLIALDLLKSEAIIVQLWLYSFVSDCSRTCASCFGPSYRHCYSCTPGSIM